MDVKMDTGAVTESVTVTDAPVALQFNTASRDLTIETKMVRDLPSATRNPFQFAALDPTILNRGSAVERQPYRRRSTSWPTGGPACECVKLERTMRNMKGRVA